MKLVHRASRRAGSRRSLLAILALTLALLTAVLAGIIGYAQLAATEALRSLATAPGSQGYFRVSTTVADDAGAQRTGADSVFAELGLTDGLQISTAPFSAPLPLVPSGGSATNLPADLTFQPVGWAPTTTPVAGSLENLTPDGAPISRSGPVPAAMPASTADSLGLVPGDTFAVEGAQGTVRLELVATLNPSGPDAAFLNPVPAEGVDSAPVAVVVPPEVIPTLTGEPKVQWAFTVDSNAASAAELSRLAEGLRSLSERMTDDPVLDKGGVISSGDLAGLLTDAADATQAVRAVLPAALVLLSAVGVVTVVQFGRLLSKARMPEGRPLRQVVMEAAPPVLVGCLLGWAVAVVLGPLISTGSETSYGEGLIEFASESWAVPLLCAGFAVPLFVGVEVYRERGLSLSQRTVRILFLGALALLVAVTGLSSWQLLVNGSPMLEADGILGLNPLAVPAPALLLVFGAALAVVVAWGLARVVESRSESRATLGFTLAARQVSRRFGSSAVPVALVAVTVGTAIFTAAYAETTSRSQQAASQLNNGSDVRVALSGPSVIGSTEDVPELAPYAGAESVTAASLAYRGEVQLASTAAPLLAVDTASLPGLLSDGANLVDIEELTTALAFEPPVPEPALALTPSATTVRMQFTSRGTSEQTANDDGASSRSASVTVWVRSEAGNLVPLPAGTLVLSGAGNQVHSLSFGLPEGLRPVAITALDVALEPSEVARGYELEITSVSSDGGIGTGQGRFIEDSTLGLAPDAFGAAEAGVEPVEEGIGMRFPEEGATTDTASARLMVGGQEVPPLPVAVTSELVANLGLAVGDSVALSINEVRTEGVVAAVASLLPGTADSAAVLADLEAYSHASLASSPAPPRPGEIWLTSQDWDSTASAVAGLSATSASVSTADDGLIGRFLSPAATVLWISVVGALLVGGAAIGAGLVNVLWSRRPEVDILRALGMRARDQVRGRRWEVLSVGGAAVVLGLLTGLGVAALAVPLLAQASVLSASAALRTPMSIDVGTLVAVLSAQVLILMLAAWIYGDRVKGQGLTIEVDDVRTGRQQLEGAVR